MVLRARRLSVDLLSGMPARWRHVRAVGHCAESFAAGLEDSERHLVVAAAWLHDIGYVDDLAVTGFHALDGARHLAELGWTAEVCGLVALHTGAIFEAEERGMAGSLSEFQPPPPHLLDTLTAADVSVGPDGDLVDPRERIAEILNRYDADDPVHRAVRRSAPALLAAVERTEHRVTLVSAAQSRSQPT